jgi:hypothetical protein
LLGDAPDRLVIIERHAVSKRLPGDGTIHRAAVDVAVPELGSDGACDRPLAGARGTVYRDDQPEHEIAG